MTICININDIPYYLKESKLYENIDSDESFDVPIEYFRKEFVINTFDDLVLYIKIFDYWMINNTPNKFYNWIFDNKDKINMDILNDLFPMNYLINEIKIIIKSENICSDLASEGFINALKYAHENGCPWYNHGYGYTLYFRHLSCLKYAHENGCPLGNATCSNAAYNGDLDCLKYAHDNGFMWDEETCSEAAQRGQLDCLKYAHENGCPWNEKTCSNAARSGYLSCLKYAHENGCPWNETTCSEAAQCGQLDCLKYAHNNGCLWNEKTCSEAAINGHLSCLKYAHENGCLYFKDSFYVTFNGHFECLKYMHKIMNCSLHIRTCAIASERGHLECLKYGHENGCIWHETFYNAAGCGHLECLKYAYENGCPLSEIIFIELASYNNFKAIKFFNEVFPNKLNISKYIVINNYNWDASLYNLLKEEIYVLNIYKSYKKKFI